MDNRDIDQLRKDMDAGTQGDWKWVDDSNLKNVFRVDEYAGVAWLNWTEEINDSFNQYDDGVSVSKEANARRIASVPDLEAAVIAQDALIKELSEALELVIGTYEEGGWPSATITISKAIVAKAKAAQ